MYYRVKKFNPTGNMFVLDKDTSLNELKSRTNIDCAGLGSRSFVNPQLIESQQIKCISLGGTTRNSKII
ncbi:hypothetical protein ACFLTE_11605, partial [Bacteroidota bacterium]